MSSACVGLLERENCSSCKIREAGLRPDAISLGACDALPYEAMCVDVCRRKSAAVLCQNCVRCPPKPRSNTVVYGDSRRVSMLRELVDRKCVRAFRCASARASGINFQACSFSVRTSVPVDASGPERLGGRYGRGPTQKLELGMERNGSGDRYTPMRRSPRHPPRAQYVSLPGLSCGS